MMMMIKDDDDDKESEITLKKHYTASHLNN